ncbi:MAG: PQQ-binding-like beta-propeller repeat protein, partial [Alphaproteobacteria bacterium]|nr:PQQ-binding-like beta-propeller repeat protein [Alphaproteobacteria bacterium]
MRPAVIATLVVCIVSDPASARNWTQFRFTDSHTGVNKFEKTLDPGNVPKLALDWQAQLGDIVDLSSPAVVGGVAYIASADGTLWAYPVKGCGRSLCDTPLWQSTNLAQIV